MIDLYVVKWDDKYGYMVKEIISTSLESSLPKDLLELVFFRALGILERRYEPRFWTQIFRGTEYICYYPGVFSKQPTVIIGRGIQKLVKLAAIDLAMRLRRKDIDEFWPEYKVFYVPMLEKLSSRNALVFAVSEETRTMIYELLLSNPAITVDKLIDLTLDMRFVPSLQDIRDTLVLMNMNGIINIKWIRGKEIVRLTRILIPIRRFNSKIFFSKADLHAVIDAYREKWNFSTELLNGAITILNKELSGILCNLLNTELHVNKVKTYYAKFLAMNDYIGVRRNLLFLKSYPVIQSYNISGRKLKEYNILS